MNDVKVFFLDLWHDLREKRLWPVAVGLLVAVIAVPLLLLDDSPKKGSAPTPAAAGAAPAGTPGSPQPADLAAAEDVNSDLGQFDSKDPFEGGGGSGDDEESSGSSASGGTVENIPGSSSSSSSGGGGSTSIGTGGDSGDTLAPGGETKTVPEGEEKTTEEKQTEEKSTPVTPFSYTVDIDFGRAGKTHLRRDVTPLTLLPDKKRPLLVFMGITSSRKTAMFKVEGAVASLKGEGICLPSRKECNFLYLRSDEDHNVQFLTDTSGRRYTLKLHDINRVSSSDLAAKKSAKRKRDRARGATSVFVGER